jgi:hypothetical protein
MFDPFCFTLNKAEIIKKRTINIFSNFYENPKNNRYSWSGMSR